MNDSTITILSILKNFVVEGYYSAVLTYYFDCKKSKSTKLYKFL